MPGPANASPLVRVDAMSLAVTMREADGSELRVTPVERVDATRTIAVPLFGSWTDRATITLRATGQASGSFDAQLELGGRRIANAASATIDATTGDFTLALTAPLADLARDERDVVKLAIVVSPGLRALSLTRLRLVKVPGAGPAIAAFDLRDVTDSLLFDAPDRKHFDLQNPEEGFWLGTGSWHLRARAEWNRPDGRRTWALGTAPERTVVQGTDVGALTIVSAQGDGEIATHIEVTFDSSHASLAGRIPPAGAELRATIESAHELLVGEHRVRLEWSRDLALRVRDPQPLRATFKRLSGVGIDFGTTATVAAFTHRGFRSLMRLGSPADGSNPAENPTYLLIDDHEALWRTLAPRDDGRRFPDLVRIVLASHSAKSHVAESPNAVVAEIKSLPERVFALDQSPQLRDRKNADFLLDEPRVRSLVRAYAYLLGRAINRPGQDVYLHYWLTYPAEFDERARALLEEEIRAGILLSVPEGIAASEVLVEMRATEPEAYAAEVCPELVNHPAIESLVAKHGELRFAVFDFGGGTLDIACGRYRPATEAEQTATGCSSVVETLQVAGNDHLGGDYLTHELTWQVHQHDAHVGEMESKQVPMQRPDTVPENKLARQPQLYKRSLAGRQNRIRFERELAIEPFKFRRDAHLRAVASLPAVRLDGSDVMLESFKSEVPAVRETLAKHLETRIEDGARLLVSLLASTPWGGTGSWREQGVLILLAGNSSRSEYVERALGHALGIENLRVWRPDSSGELQGVVLYETPTRTERGVEILGVTPKTAVALGVLKIANREVHLVRAAQGFSYFVGDMKGFPPRFSALIAMGAAAGNPAEWGPHYVDFGTWDSRKPLRVCTEYEPGRMTSNDARLLAIPTGLPPGVSGKLFVCVTAPTRIGLHLALEGDKFVRSELNLAPYLS